MCGVIEIPQIPKLFWTGSKTLEASRSGYLSTHAGTEQQYFWPN